MVYAGQTTKGEVELGVSGRLMKRNLVMWDPQTNSLWSQLKGEALSGPMAGTKLDLLPSVLVPYDTWQQMHPETLVLDLSEVRRKAWFYSGADLVRGKVKDDVLALGLRRNDESALITLPDLHRSRLVERRLGDDRVIAVWVASARAVVVYQVNELGDAELELRGDHIVVNGTISIGGEDRMADLVKYDALTGRCCSSCGSDLVRFPYLPTYVSAWNRLL